MPIITMPKLSDTMSEGTIASWKKKKGDKVAMGDILADIETDKATMEMEAFDDGVLEELYVEEGGKAPVGSKIALLLADGESREDLEGNDESAETEKKSTEAEKKNESAKSSDPAKTEKPAEKENADRNSASSARIKASPLAKKIAAERGVSLQGITGTGPGSRIVAKDVPQKGTTAAGPADAITAKAGEGATTTPLSNMRRTIAERLVASKQQIPHFYLSIEVDAGPLLRIRKELNAANEAAGEPKLTINDFVLQAIARATASHPKINASWGGDAIIQHAGVHLSVAIAVEDGLVTPTLADADKLSLKQISTGVKDLATRARDKKLKPEEYQGGTLTVSTLGAYGIDQFYAIINPPQAAIVAIGTITKKPVVNAKNEIVVGERMHISLSGDHRVVDGAVGAEFLATLRRLVENPAMMLF